MGLIVDDFGNYDALFTVYDRSFTIPQLKRVVISYQSDSPFTAWSIALDWEVGEVLELLEILAELQDSSL